MPNPFFLNAVVGANIIVESVRALLMDGSTTSSELEVKAKVMTDTPVANLQWKPVIVPMASSRTLVLLLAGEKPEGDQAFDPQEQWVVYRQDWGHNERTIRYVTLRNGEQSVTTTIAPAA
jgi:hypothetical protein